MDRRQALSQWIETELGAALTELEPASADASFRRYFRARCGDKTWVAMDAPPVQEDCRPFIRVARLLADAGVHVPHVIAQDLERGFLLLSDLGTVSYLAALNEATADALFDAAVDALLRWQLASRAGVLPPYDRALLTRELELFPDWYVSRHLRCAISSRWRQTLDEVFGLILENNLAQPAVYVHRDYMPRNLMVCDPNPGVLDFQDAVYGPISYDVASLFRDAFVSWEEARVRDWATRYWQKAQRVGLPVRTDFAEFYRDFEWMGVQRHLKVLGIFARLCYRDGKCTYLADTPRFVTYVRATARRYRELAPLAALFDELERASATPRRSITVKAMILAAGRGERMRPLTDRRPKPLLEVGGKPLIEWHVEKLGRAGFDTIAINHAHLGGMIEAVLGDGRRFGVTLKYSAESAPLETAGGIATALPLIDADCFAVVNADVFSDFDYRRLAARVEALPAASEVAHLVLVDNPVHHPRGDFALVSNRLEAGADRRFTFAGIAVYRRELFAGVAAHVVAPLAPLLYRCVAEGRASGEHHAGCWVDVGTPERLAHANRLFAGTASR